MFNIVMSILCIISLLALALNMGLIFWPHQTRYFVFNIPNKIRLYKDIVIKRLIDLFREKE